MLFYNNRCKYSYNDINVKVVGPQGPRFSEEGPKYKVLKIIPIFFFSCWLELQHCHHYSISITQKHLLFFLFFFILTHPSLILLRYGRWELKMRTEPNMHLRCGTHPKGVMGNGNWALVDENCLNQTGSWSMSSRKYGINPMACG